MNGAHDNRPERVEKYVVNTLRSSVMLNKLNYIGSTIFAEVMWNETAQKMMKNRPNTKPFLLQRSVSTGIRRHTVPRLPAVM